MHANFSWKSQRWSLHFSKFFSTSFLAFENSSRHREWMSTPFNAYKNTPTCRMLRNISVLFNPPPPAVADCKQWSRQLNSLASVVGDILKTQQLRGGMSYALLPFGLQEPVVSRRRTTSSWNLHDSLWVWVSVRFFFSSPFADPCRINCAKMGRAFLFSGGFFLRFSAGLHMWTGCQVVTLQIAVHCMCEQLDHLRKR